MADKPAVRQFDHNKRYLKLKKMMVIYALLSGLSAAWASIMGKLSGFEAYNNLSIVSEYAMRAWFLVVMIILNGVMWILYVKALQSSKSSLQPTIIITATNYVSTGLFGYLVFREVTGLLWWSGITLILVGVGLIIKSSDVKPK